ncbi:hypothetical protein Tco_1040141, partial [Tanacetum coccineum]
CLAEMAFGNFMFAEDDEEMTFLPHEPSLGFYCSSPYTSINNEPPLLEVEPLESSGSVVERMKSQKCRTKGFAKPLVKRKLVYAGSSSRSTRQKSSPAPIEAKAESSAYLTIFDDEKARELLKVVDQMKGECEVLKEKVKARDIECEELRAKCEAAMADFDKNPAVNVLRPKIKSLLDEVKENKCSMDKMLLEIQKWASYQENLATLDSKVAALKTNKCKLEAAEALLHKEIKALKCDRGEVVSKVVSYIAMELVHSDEMAMLIGRLVSSAIFYGRCATLEEVANMKEPFNLAKVKGYRPMYKKEHMKAVEALLSKKPKSLHRLTPTKTNAPALSAPPQKATPSSAPIPKHLYLTPKV